MKGESVGEKREKGEREPGTGQNPRTSVFSVLNVLYLPNWPTNSDCLIIIWLFFFIWKQQGECALTDSFVWELICYLENSLHQCALPSPTLRACGSWPPWCTQSICIQITYSWAEITNPSLGWSNVYLVTHTLLSWGMAGRVTPSCPSPYSFWNHIL